MDLKSHLRSKTFKVHSTFYMKPMPITPYEILKN